MSDQKIVNLEKIIQDWGKLNEYPNAIAEALAVVERLEVLWGPVVEAYVPQQTKPHVAMKFERNDGHNQAWINFGHVDYKHFFADSVESGYPGVGRTSLSVRTPVSSPVVVSKKQDRAMEIESLAVSIACCSEIKRACVDSEHTCHKIVMTQKEFGEEHRQVPEAWAGNLEHARVIFVSSNPSISTPQVAGTGEEYPLGGYSDAGIRHPDWPIERVIDFQVNRLDQARENPFVTGDAQFLCSDGLYRGSDSKNGTKASQKYWKSAIKQVQDLLGPTFDLSRDLCMTEIVHCKSKGEQGVSKASGTCSEKYLASILQLSGSLLVLVGGAKARAQVHAHRQEWQEDGLVTWDISDGFGFFGNSENHPGDHVGLIRIEDTTKIVIATEQLSYASNTNRFVQAVIGEVAFNKLATHLRSDSPAAFGSREEVLKFLGI